MKVSVKKYTNYFMGFLLFAVFFNTAISSFVLWFILPRGIGLHGTNSCFPEWETGCCEGLGIGVTGNPFDVFEWPRYIWVEFHAWIGIALAGLIFIHLLLHWSWIIEATKRAKSCINRGLRVIAERYATAIVLFVLFIFEVVSGCVIWLILPRGEYDYYNMLAGVGRTFWGLQRNVWSDLHAWAAVVLAAVIIIHIIIHWRWIFSMTLGKRLS